MATAVPPSASAASKEDDVDLFGSDESDVDEAAEALKAQRLKEYQARKAAKPKVTAKSIVVLEVKPWDDETDMAALTDAVLSITLEGLVWGSNRLVPVGYNIEKLQVTCVVEDDKVSVDDLIERIGEFEDYVQSTDIVSFNKI